MDALIEALLICLNDTTHFSHLLLRLNEKQVIHEAVESVQFDDVELIAQVCLVLFRHFKQYKRKLVSKQYMNTMLLDLS